MATRWGICGTGKICQDFTAALTSQPQSQLKAVAVAARQLDKAQAFAKDYGIPKAYGSYKELSQDPDVDVVYIGTIHPAHYEQALLFLNAGKHVLVEKVVAMNLKQLKEMTSLAREKKLFFMEAVWTRFFPAFKKVLEELAAGAIGTPRILTVNFCKPLKDVPRIKDRSLGGGGLLDLGVYPLNIATFLFGKPDSVSVEGTLLENNDVDEASCITFKYKDGRMAQLFYSIQFEGTNETVIFGTNGRIQVHNPTWCPTEVTLPSGKMTFDLPTTDRKFNFDNSVGLAYEAIHTRECIQQGLTESPLLPMSHSETVMEIIEQIKRKIGLHYDVDD